MNIFVIVARLLDFYSFVIVVYAIMSWFAQGSRGWVREVYHAVALVAEPYVGLFRRILPAVMIGSGGIDFSPLAALLVLQFLSSLFGGIR